MKVEYLLPVTENVQEFTFEEVLRIPPEAGCYVLTNFNNEILYIGKASNIQRRILQHLENDVKTKATSRGVVYFVHFRKIYIEKNENIEALERGWMNCYLVTYGVLPILNKMYAG